MATYTTNLGLKMPAQSDKIRIADINGNMDDIDSAIGAVGSKSIATQMGDIRAGLAIVAVNNTHAAIASGEYVYLTGHSTLDDGLYIASSAIAQNATLSSSNLTAVSGGGLNSLSNHIANINKAEDKKITSIGSYFTERDAFKARRVGNTIDFFGYVNITTEVPAATNFADIGFSTAEGNVLFVTANGSTQRLVHCTQGKLKPESGYSLPTGFYYIVGCAVMVVS